MIVEKENITGLNITSLMLCLFIFTILFYVILDLYKKRHLLRFSRDLQLYTFFPIVGNVLYIIGENFFSCLQKKVKEYGLPCTVWIGHECHYLTADAEEAKIILTNPKAYEKSWIYSNFGLLIGDSILITKYEHWKTDRKIFQKGFNQQLLKGFVNIFYEKSCNLVDAIREHKSKNKSELFNRFSLGSFVVNSTGLTNENNEFNITKILDRFMVIISKRMISGQIFPKFIWKYTSDGRAFFKNSDSVRDYIIKLSRKTKQHLLEKKELQEDVNSNNTYLMDLMLGNDLKVYDEESIIHQFSTFTIAATETTGLTLAFTLTFLGMTPNVQEKVYEEVKDAIGLEKPICYSDLANLKYTERAILETMRLLPAIPLVGRLATADLDLGTRIAPAGTNLIVAIYNLHRSEKYWKDPLKYDPDRFLPEEVAKRPPYSYIPFSGGPRNCIGMKYGIMATKTAVANVIRNYKVFSNYKSVEDIKVESAFTLKPAHDLDCEFIRRSMS